MVENQKRDLFAASDDAELGPMGTMTTVMHNDSTREMLAAIRCGPLAEPLREEMIEFLVGAYKDTERPNFQEFAYEHVLSSQRRVHALKEHFMQRNKGTPRGVLEDWWDRTEAQARAALHAHILEWWRKRCPTDFPRYKPIATVPRTMAGDEPKQRPSNAWDQPKIARVQNTLLKHSNSIRLKAPFHIICRLIRLVKNQEAEKHVFSLVLGYKSAQ